MVLLDDTNFEIEVLQYIDGPVLVDFWGEKCEKCLQLMPEVEALEVKYEGKVKFCSLNTTKYRKLAIDKRVLGLPTMILYNKGEKKEVLTPNKIKGIEDIEALISNVTG